MESIEPDFTSFPSSFRVSYSPEKGSPRRLQFEPRDDSTGWWLIELRYTENSWQTVGREPLTDVQSATQKATECPTAGHEALRPSRPLAMFKIVAQERAWQILQTVSLLEEPVSREQLRQFLTAYDSGDVNIDQPFDPELKKSLNDTIREMAMIDVIEETPNGITSGPQFGHAFTAVVVS